MNSGNAHTPRLVVAAPQGRSGKTTLSLGICAALSARGLAVQPFKKGPDYIDPSWLSAAAGRACRSLDLFFLETRPALRAAFRRGARQADLCLVEGNHGLYDSGAYSDMDEDGFGSTADVARSLQAPVLLVVNATRMTRSAAAMISGYQNFEPETPIAGVLLNQVARSRHEARLREAIERHCRIPVVGALPRQVALKIPDRHLGLIPEAEDPALVPAIEACREAVEHYVDLDQVLQIARSAPPLPLAEAGQSERQELPGQPVPIGVIRDRAFSFYYPENLEALERAGARLAFIDALQDERLPEIAGLYIGGGFPEVFMDELSANRSLRMEIRKAVEDGLPVYAECGGLMYLSRRIHWQGRSAEMAGALPCEVQMHDRPQGHGYVAAVVEGENPFFPAGVILRGHEFHHSQITYLDGMPTAYRLTRGQGLGEGRDGLVYRNVLAAYTHLHADGSPAWADGLVSRAGEFFGCT